MYAKSLHIYDFKCFGKAVLELQFPGRTGKTVSAVDNVNLVLGDNGGGKSSVLRALAIAVLAPSLLGSGFVPYRLVRRAKVPRPQVKRAVLKVEAVLDTTEPRPPGSQLKSLELIAHLETRGKSDLDHLHLAGSPASTIVEMLFDDFSPAFFVVGYGATRRVETGEFSESSARLSRGLRYQRVAGLFEDHVALRPLQAWMPRIQDKDSRQFDDIVAQINRILPENIRFSGQRDEWGRQYLFEFNGAPTPFSSLSDGYKAFIGWVSDFIGHLCEVAEKSKIDSIPGIVLVDEIDLHLHPEWQRSVVPMLANAFPRIQFVFTSHSPLVASTVRRENVFITDTADTGTSTIKQLEEKVYGRSSEQLLLSSYFGLLTTRPDEFQAGAQSLFDQAAEGDSNAALAYLDRLTAPAGIKEKPARGKQRK